MTGRPAPGARPEVHFTPPANWLNDPNGLVVLDGTHHLFYQHNPVAPVWGNLHWGHATSTDLLHWDHQPVALAPDEVGEIYSGSAVVDHGDTAGFGAGAVVAVFTHAANDGQHQSLAFSTDGGTTWAKHAGNPVLRAPEGHRDFRDPKVLRWVGADDPDGDGTDGWWLMVLAVGPDLWLYRSDDLRDWTRTSTLALLDPAGSTVLEVPDLVPVPVEPGADGHRARRWVLIASVLPRDPEGGRRWVGWLPVEFDGLSLTPSDTAGLRRLDEGPDLYAPMVWDAADGLAPILIGWMNEAEIAGHRSAGGEPAWCGRMSIPRRLTLDADRIGGALIQRPTFDTTAEGRPTLAIDPGERAAVPLADGATVLQLRTATGPIGVRCLIPTAAGAPRLIDVVGPAIALDGLGTGVDGAIGVTPIGGGTAGDAGDAGAAELLIDAGSVEVFADGGRCVASLLTGTTARSIELRNASTGELHVTVARPVAERPEG